MGLVRRRDLCASALGFIESLEERYVNQMIIFLFKLNIINAFILLSPYSMC